jgi:putative lumazine-binding protein
MPSGLLRTLMLALLFAPAIARAQSSAERVAVERAVLDYVEGFYEGDTAKLVRSIRPEVMKYGFYIPRDSTRYVGEAMPWPEFLSYARGIKERNQPAPATAPKRVEIFDIQDQTASAKLTAWWGTDYLLLAKYDGKWMIRQVLWQSPPKR